MPTGISGMLLHRHEAGSCESHDVYLCSLRSGHKKCSSLVQQEHGHGRLGYLHVARCARRTTQCPPYEARSTSSCTRSCTLYSGPLTNTLQPQRCESWEARATLRPPPTPVLRAAVDRAHNSASWGVWLASTPSFTLLLVVPALYLPSPPRDQQSQHLANNCDKTCKSLNPRPLQRRRQYKHLRQVAVESRAVTQLGPHS